MKSHTIICICGLPGAPNADTWFQYRMTSAAATPIVNSTNCSIFNNVYLKSNQYLNQNTCP